MYSTHRFSVRTTLRYQVQTSGWLLFNVAIGQCPGQRLTSESLTNSAGLKFSEQIAPDGMTRFHGVSVDPGYWELNYQAEVERIEQDFSESWEPREASLVELPSEVTRYLYPSRYCESDKLVRLAAKQFGGLLPGHSRVAAICNWINERIDYQPGATDAHSSAVDCLISSAGVCRDFSHLGIAFCRALGIPARYGSAYVHQLPVPDFHAFFEVWLGDRWWYYDATRLAPQPGFILIGTGHDAADASVATMSRGVQFDSMEIHVDKLSPAPLNYTTSPITFH